MKYSITAILLALFLMVTACGGEQAEEVVAQQPEGTVGESAEAADDNAAEPEVVAAVEAAAEVEFTNGAYTQLEVPVDWSYIGAQQAFVEEFTSHSTCRIFIANFDTDENMNTLAREPGRE